MKLKQRFLLALLTLFAFTSARAQENDRIDVDLNLIKVNVTMNPEHYRELMDRYMHADTTLRLDEMAPYTTATPPPSTMTPTSPSPKSRTPST